MIVIRITTRVCGLPNIFEINEINYKEKIGQLGTKIGVCNLKEAERKDADRPAGWSGEYGSLLIELSIFLSAK